MKPKRLLWSLVLVLLVGLIAWTIWENNSPMITETTIVTERLPNSFSGYRIAHISDMHNAQYGADNATLLEMLRHAQPDMIAITGDFVDSRRTDFNISLRFAQQAVKIAPVYYVMGNHEARLTDDYPRFEQQLIQCGVTVLRNEESYIARNGQTIRIVGIDDPRLITMNEGENEAIVLHTLSSFEAKPDTYTILLSHRPELFDAYCQYQIDLALTGHNHGGLIRIPFVGGLYAGQEFFPKYDDGLFTNGMSTMFLNRGLGNSSYTFRINNRPEIAILTLA